MTRPTSIKPLSANCEPQWLGLGGFASYTNAAIKFLESKVSIAFRTRLTRYIHDLYLNDNLNYYKLSNLDGGVGQGADQFITQDLTLFCAAAANLYSSLGKPFVDLCVFNFQLYRSLGPLALSGLVSNYFLTASILRRLSPPFGKLKAVEGRKEGDFRSLHARLIANAEEVAFYGGADTEKTFLNKEYKSLKGWMEGIYMLKIRYNILEDFILKYSWSAYGYLLAALPVFLPQWGGVGGMSEMAEHAVKGGRERNRMKDFITNKRLMLSLADAGGRMMYSIKDLAELAGYTSRVYTLISTLHRVHADAYYLRNAAQNELYSLSDVQGTIQKGFDGVRFEHVPIVAPGLWPQGGEELLDDLSMIVRSGEHLLISGPNGVGKTAIARVLAGLWPVYRGLVSRPKNIGQDGIMFLPQRPYLSPGTLRDQVIYPDGHLDMRSKGKSEEDLKRVLEEAKLGYLPDREGGWDTRKEWKDVLSGGEKQRMGFARLLYHEPQYAIIDEGTSAVSSDVEGLLYETCKDKGISEFLPVDLHNYIHPTNLCFSFFHLQLLLQSQPAHPSRSTTPSTLSSARATAATSGNSSASAPKRKRCRWKRKCRRFASVSRRWKSGSSVARPLIPSWRRCGQTRRTRRSTRPIMSPLRLTLLSMLLREQPLLTKRRRKKR